MKNAWPLTLSDEGRQRASEDWAMRIFGREEAMRDSLAEQFQAVQPRRLGLLGH
jgi:hypothetical protein